MRTRSAGRRYVRGAAVAALAAVAVLAGACAPAPGADPGEAVADLFEGGTYPIAVDVAPQTYTAEFDVFGMATCTATATTAEVDIDGSLTLQPAELAPGLDRVTIPGAVLELPGSRVSAGSLSLSCDGQHVGSIGVSIEFDGSASVQSAVLDVPSGTVSLTDPTISVTNARVTFAGGPGGSTPVPLDPITVTVPTVSVDV